MTTQVTTQPRTSLIEKMAAKYGVDPTKMLATLKATAFRQRDNREISNEQMMALLVVADQYNLNPWTKEIFAYEDKGAIIPVVSVDGWSRIINSNEHYDGIEFRYSDTAINPVSGKLCPEWCEAVIYHKNRGRPTIVREYLDEVYVPARGNPPKAGPWQSHTKRMLRHKTLIQGSRVAFGFSGIYDEDEAHRIVDVTVVSDAVTTGSTATLEEQLRQRAASADPIDAEFIDTSTGEVVTASVVDEDPDPAAASDDIDPVEIEALINSATTDEAIHAIVDRVANIEDTELRRDLTRLALKRKSALMREAGKI